MEEDLYVWSNRKEKYLMIVDKIYKYLSSEELKLDEFLLKEVADLAKHNFSRQFMEEKEERELRLSLSGHCVRKLAYLHLGFPEEGKELDSRAKITFFLGDLVELALLKLAKLAGCYIFATGLNQLEISIKINEVEIKGHPDGLLLHEGKLYVVECKSMSDYGFKDFEKGNVSYEYLAQVNMYMHVLNLDNAVFVALDKNNSLLGEKIVKKDEKIVKECIERFKKAISSTDDNLPERDYKPDDKGKLPWQCSYCPYWRLCYPEAERVLVVNHYELFIKKGGQ